MATEASPTVSIIIPTYNRSVTLGWALRSVLCQDFVDFEVWIIGDGCTDDTAEVVVGFGDVRFQWLNLPTNSGSQAVPNNEGLRRARGRYIAHLGHDDLWLPDHLSSLIGLLETTGADFVHAMIAMYGPEGLMGVVGAPSRGRTYANARMHPSGWLYRRAVAERVGEWQSPESIGQAIDTDYARRVFEAGFRIAPAEQISVLKFPSNLWGSYARSDGWQQLDDIKRIEEDAEELRRKIARDVAVLCSREWRAVPSWNDVVRMAYSYVREALLRPKSRLLNPIRTRTFQYLRRRALRDRGLTG